MKNRSLPVKAGAALLACTLIAIPCLRVGAKESSSLQEPASSAVESGTEKTEETKKETTPLSSAKVDKTEVVHVSAAADGTPEKITVEAVLKNSGDAQTIEDRTILENIKNTEGDEEFTLKDDGTLLWENHGEDITYEGTATAELPVSVHVTYSLDGKETEPEALVGKSGRLKLRFDYENHTSEEIDVDGKKVTVKVPFVMLSALFLDEDVFRNVEVENGKIMEMDGQSVVVGYALPGLSESLKLADYEPVQDMELPEYVEVTADVTDFALDFTATIASTGLFSEMDTSDLDDADELTEAMEELNDASGELVDGMSSLFDGVSEFQGSMGEYLKAVKAVDTGVGSFKTALAAMDKQKSALQEGAKSLAESLSAVNGQLQKIPADAGELSDSSEDMQKAVAAAAALSEDTGKLMDILSGLGNALEQAGSFAAEAESFRDKVKEKFSAAEKEIQAAKDALDAVSAEADLDKGKISVDVSAAKDAVRAAAKDAGLTDEQAAAVADAVTRDRIDIQVDKDAATALVKGKEDVASRLDSAAASLQDQPTLSVPDLGLDTEGIRTVLADMQSQLDVLKTYAGALTSEADSIEDMQNMLKEIKASSAALADGSSQLSAGVTALTEGISGLYEGSVKLKEGTSALTDASSAISQGLTAMKKGAEALKDGMKTFDEEGIQELSDLAGDDLTAVIDRVKALKDADVSYDTYSGLAEGKRGEVRFIIETAGIEKEE